MTIQYLDRRAASRYLTDRGIPVRPETLARWACTGRYQLPIIRLGRLVRYDIADLDALVAAHRVTPGGQE